MNTRPSATDGRREGAWRSRLRRHALALWFAGLALLGFLRSYAAIARHGALDSSAVLWLLGSSSMAAIALVLLIRSRHG